jgi:hypothetical protein
MCFKPLGCLSIPLAQGVAGASGNSVLNGTGVPSPSLGVNGDFYIDTNNSQIYGPKTAGAWGGPTSLLGLTGNGVLSGAGAPLVGLGENGDFYIDTTANAIYGPKTLGSWGSPTSLVGTNGANGTTRLYEVLTEQSSVIISPSSAQLASFTIPANTLVNNGDSLLVKAIYRQTANVPNIFQGPERKILFNGNSIVAVGFVSTSVSVSTSSSFSLFRSELEIIKLSSNSIIVRNSHDGGPQNSGPSLFQSFLGSIDFTVTNTLSFEVLQYVPSTYILVTLTIDKISS